MIFFATLRVTMTYKSLLIGTVLGILLTPHVLFAEDFNPHLIITDEELTDTSTMTREDIQAFLEYKGGMISRLLTDDVVGTPRTVSDIIYRASQTYQINPKYLLVKLQKEQSLVTDKNPTQKQLDWATGYGICDSCSMNDPSLQKHRGLGTQIDSAAGIMRWYYENLSNEDWIKRKDKIYSIDTATVIPQSNATGFLYTYTPHIQGNQNFWKLWRTWFAQAYPNGTLVKTPNDSTVYVIIDGQRRAFTSMGALVSRFDPKMIVQTSAAELSKYDLGSPITLPNYAILHTGSTYYLLDNTTLRPFENQETVRALGYNPDEIIEVSDSDISGFPLGTIISARTVASASDIRGKVVRTKEDGQLYLLKENIMSLIPNDAIYQFNYGSWPIETVSIGTLQNYTYGEPITFKEGALFGVKGSNKIYVTEHGFKRHIASEKVFTSLGYDWNNIVWVDQLTGSLHRTAPPVEAEASIVIANPNTSLPLIENTAPNGADEGEPPTGPAPMVVTPKENTVFIGAAIETPINTYVIADKSGTILLGKNIDDQRPIASFTKLMTAYRLAAEGLNMFRTVTYNTSIHKPLYNNFRLANGETVKNSDLWNALLVSSLNLPANMLVSSVTPVESRFIQGMNAEALGWGLTKTAFTEPSGADIGNVSTAREMLTMWRRITDIGDIQNTLATPTYTYTEVKDLDGKPNHNDTHTNQLQTRTDLPFVVLYSKTGYLEESGAGLAMQVKRKSDGKEFTIITMGNPDYANRFLEPERIARIALQSLN